MGVVLLQKKRELKMNKGGPRLTSVLLLGCGCSSSRAKYYWKHVFFLNKLLYEVGNNNWCQEGSNSAPHIIIFKLIAARTKALDVIGNMSKYQKVQDNKSDLFLFCNTSIKCTPSVPLEMQRFPFWVVPLKMKRFLKWKHHSLYFFLSFH